VFAEKPRAGQMLNHISFYTDDAQAMRNYLKAHKAKVPAKVAIGQTGKNYNITDPDGNLVGIVEYQPDGWTTRDEGKFMPAMRISESHCACRGDDWQHTPAIYFYHGILGFNEVWRHRRNEPGVDRYARA